MPRSPWPRQLASLLLREVDAADLRFLVAVRNDPTASRFLPTQRVDPATFSADWLAIPKSDTDHSCVVERDGHLVASGFLKITGGAGQATKSPHTEAVIGYLVSPEASGQGIATELAGGLLDVAFCHLGVRRVTAVCYAANQASAHILEKIGMRRERHGIADTWHDELGWIDSYTYALLSTEYPTP